MTTLVTAGISLCCAAAYVASWTFDTDADTRAWEANSHLANVRVQDGILSADAVDWDPFFTCRNLDMAATPWQYVLVRLKANRPGLGELFWSGETTGQYGGFSPEKRTPFQAKGDGQWEDIPIFPFWQAEGTIRQLRLDVYADAHFDIDTIRIAEWGGDQEPLTDVFAWEFGGDTRPWQIAPDTCLLFAPRLRLPVDAKGWVTVRLRSDADATAAVLWSVAGARGVQRQDFPIRGDNRLRAYHVELAGIPDWRSPVLAFGIQLPRDATVYLDAIRIGEEPSGPPEGTVRYLGFEDGVNRAGRPVRVLAQIGNCGGSRTGPLTLALDLPAGLRVADGEPEKSVGPLDYDDQVEAHWFIVADVPGTYPVRMTAEGDGAPEPAEATLTFLPPLDLPKADYVQEPRRVPTDIDVCMYYFPGWNADAKWDCIRRIAPVRKPLLGYYDEGNPECVDWQIKWAVENGVTCFLVDWYWVAGQQQLEHWFEAYRKAHYRNYLKVAIMWANHNPPGTHSREDWRAVNQEWIGKYFPLDTYYRIDGKPAVFLWSPANIRNDLNGSTAVAEAFQESQNMARAAGYDGIAFIAMFGHESESGVASLLEEGYYGATSYHEWGRAQQLAKDPKRAEFEDVVRTAPDAWKAEAARCGKLAYYPAVDTGWDSRPWHGDNAFVIGHRTPERFERLLRAAKEYCVAIGRNMVVLGPANEWGEGSYIEPNTEFGFDMLERVRAVFAKDDPTAWPVNVSPADVALGPYDFPASSPVSAWLFENDTEGWTPMMGVSSLACRDHALRFTTWSDDPAIVVHTRELRAVQFKRAILHMQLAGSVPIGDQGQLFFSVGGRAAGEADSFRFPLATDGLPHTYTIDLTANPRWRSRISSLRFDPCGTRGIEVVLDGIALE